MPTWMYQPPTMPKNASVEQKIEILESVIVEMNKRLIWLTSKMDSQNVKRLDTDETVIKSADGTTEILGPVLVQKDSGGTTRLQLGYDIVSGDFLFHLNNAAGNTVFEVDSTGEQQFTGKPLMAMYDNQAPPVLRLKQGYDAATGDFVFELYNEAGVKTVGIDSSGDATFAGTITGSAISGGTISGTTITGGTIQTAASGTRIVITGNTLLTYGSAGTLMGPVWGTGVGANYGDLSFYDDDLETFRIENALAGGGWNLRPMNSGSLAIGYGGATVLPSGNWNFHSATIINLITNTEADHTHTDSMGGLTSADGAHSHTAESA